jgi:hypothetical protein
MKTKHAIHKFAILCVAMSGSAVADNPAFAPGDLVLFFQQEGGADTVYVRLGNAGNEFRGAASGPGAPNKVNFLNINNELTSAFGSGWADDTSIHAGLAAVWGTSSLSTSLQDGDPSRTVYISDRRNAVGTVGQANSTGYTLPNTTASSTAASRILSMNAVFDNNYSTAAAVSPASVSDIDNKNPFLAPGIQGVAFETFEGGVQQAGTAGSFGTFGAAGEVEFALDLYRILARNNISGQVSGTPLVGSFEGTVTINASGNVSFISQGSGSTSPFTTWIDSYNPPLTNPADRAESADPDGDGATNLEEFGFAGHPANGSDNGTGQVLTVDANGDSQQDLTLTLQVRSGATFSPAGNDLVSAPVDDVVYRIEGSTDLATWDSAVSEVTPSLGSGSPKAGYVFKTFRLNAGNGLPGKGFLRASVTK